MNSENTNRNKWQGMVPRGHSAIISTVIVAIVAFSLGGLLLSGGNPNESMAADNGHSTENASKSEEPTLWTCSMHPQIKLPNPGKCPICFMDLIPLETGHGGDELDPNQIRMSETAVKLAEIQTTPVKRAFAERTVRMVGKLNYDETRVSYITAWVPGRLDKLFIDYTGARVSKGDHMVHMYSPELISAQEELLQAKKAVSALNNTKSTILKSTANETLRSAREKLRLYGLSKNQIDSIEKGNTPMEHLTITAPAGGVVVHKEAKEGMYVTTGTRIYTIADLSRLWVMLQAYESDLPWLREGQHVKFTSPSFPGETFDAVIDFIDPVVDQKTRTVDIRAEVDNSDGRLKPEMFVSGKVQSTIDSKGIVNKPEKAENAPLVIPASAPLITGKRAVVYVQVPDSEGVVFEGREIALGPRAGDYYVVKGGLSEGEKVVTNGAFKIDSELQIQAKPSMMSPKDDLPIAEHRQVEPVRDEMTVELDTTAYMAGTAKRLDDCEEAQVALTPVYESYLNTQMALANDDLSSAKASYHNLMQAIDKVDMSLFKNKSHTRWMKISQKLKAAAERGSSAENIEDARDAFFYASKSAIELHDTFGHSGDTPLYLTFCPMARDHTGAYWLQTENIVWNSFYGEAMLRCGEIKQELAGSEEVTE